MMFRAEIPGPGLEEYPPRVVDHPDDTGYPHLIDRAHIAHRERDTAAARGTLTWRLILRAAYRDVMAATTPDQITDALYTLEEHADDWRQAIRQRGQ